jgi:hypothetical protein
VESAAADMELLAGLPALGLFAQRMRAVLEGDAPSPAALPRLLPDGGLDRGCHHE